MMLALWERRKEKQHVNVCKVILFIIRKPEDDRNHICARVLNILLVQGVVCCPRSI